jgi:hypothetical protein
MAETFEGGTSCQYHNHNNQANIANISNTLIKRSITKVYNVSIQMFTNNNKSVQNKSPA